MDGVVGDPSADVLPTALACAQALSVISRALTVVPGRLGLRCKARQSGPSALLPWPAKAVRGSRSRYARQNQTMRARTRRQCSAGERNVALSDEERPAWSPEFTLWPA